MDRGAGADGGDARPPPRAAAAPRARHRAAPDGAPASPAPAATRCQRRFRDGWGCQGRWGVRPGRRAGRPQQDFAESRGSSPVTRRKDPFPPQTRTPARWPAAARPAAAGPSGVPALYRGGGQHRGPAWRLDTRRQFGRRRPVALVQPARAEEAFPPQPPRYSRPANTPRGMPWPSRSGYLAGYPGAEQQRALHGDRGQHAQSVRCVPEAGIDRG